MIKCDYCGRVNPDGALICAGCGMPFRDFQDEKSTGSQRRSAWLQRLGELNAFSATLVFLIYIVAQIFCVLFIDLAGRKISLIYGIHDPRQMVLVLRALDPAALMLSYVLGAGLVFLASYKLIQKHLKDTGTNGAAWVIGRWVHVAKALVIGLVVGGGDQAFVLLSKNYVPYKNLDSLHKMAFTPGLPQVVWASTAIILAPLVEEMLFRGVLYGGYRVSFGKYASALCTTMLFVLVHLPYYIHSWINIIGIAFSGCLTLWCRLRWEAIGPPIAFHAAYNLMAVLVVVYKTCGWSL
jgi:membrane protease YdiL (CAAX protease family)